MKDTVLVLGNGFDLDLGLRTSYSDFVNYINRFYSRVENRLIESIVDKWEENKGWVDLEALLREWAVYDSMQGNPLVNNPNINNEYIQLLDLMDEYMSMEKYPAINEIGVTYEVKSCAFNLLDFASKNSKNISSIYSLNYTDMGILSKRINIDLKDIEVVNIHGVCSDGDNKTEGIVLGIDSEIPTADKYLFMIKTLNDSYKSGIINALDSASNVIFFGVGFGITDFPYFRDFFMKVVRKKNVNVSIFTNGNGSSSFYQISKMTGVDIANLRDNRDLSIYNTSEDGCFEKFEKKIGR